LLIGEIPFVDQLAPLCIDAGYAVSTHRVEDALESGGLDRVRREAGRAGVAVDVVSASLDAKRTIVSALDAALPPEALLLASALSSTATHAGSWTQMPNRMVGFAALPPVARGGTIEVAAGLRSDPSMVDRAGEFFASLGMDTAIVKDSVGLVLPRIVCGLVNEAAIALAEGVAEPGDIDLAMQLGTNYPRGPLEWGDLIGLDVVLAVLRGLHEETGDDRYRPATIIRQYVRAGWLGEKTGRGFYEYSAQSPVDGNP
jgi:3-hydroxybutyryl-CoA dehydrogenase